MARAETLASASQKRPAWLGRLYMNPPPGRFWAATRVALGFLVTPRHFVTANHWAVPNGSYVAVDGRVGQVARGWSLVDKERSSSPLDIWVGRLREPLLGVPHLANVPRTFPLSGVDLWVAHQNGEGRARGNIQLDGPFRAVVPPGPLLASVEGLVVKTGGSGGPWYDARGVVHAISKTAGSASTYGVPLASAYTHLREVVEGDGYELNGLPGLPRVLDSARAGRLSAESGGSR